MKDLKFFRSVSSWAHIIFLLMRIVTVIAAVCVLIGIFALVALPQNTFFSNTSVSMEIKADLSRILGHEWPEVKEELQEETALLPEGIEITDEGMSIQQEGTTVSIENRVLGLSLIPSFVELILEFSLFLFLGKAFKILKLAPNPFDAEAAKHLRTAGTFLMVHGVLPAICSSLVTLLTKTTGYFETKFDLFTVFFGFLLWALSDLFLFAKDRISAPIGFYGESTPQNPDSDIHPDAF